MIDFEAALRALANEGVQFIVVGGAADSRGVRQTAGTSSSIPRPAEAPNSDSHCGSPLTGPRRANFGCRLLSRRPQ